MTDLDTRPPHPAAPVAHTGPTRAERPRWERPALCLLLLATAAGYLWNLGANGWANSFYSAAAQAGSQSWEAFLFGSLDAGNAISVDKPPAALWVTGLSVRLFGLSSWSILVPQVLMGVAAVAVVFMTVRRHFGPAAGLIAGAVLASTPVAVLMFRFNNPDALLTLLMALAAWATLRGIESSDGRRWWRWAVLTGAVLGLGFLTKSLQVLLVAPGFAAAWMIAARGGWLRRLGGLALAGLAFLVAAGWWVALVELLPTSMRPYIGGSQSDSFLELTLGYNGFGRLTGDEVGSVGGGMGWGQTGWDRMFAGVIGGQVSWLLPAALLLLVAGLVWRGRAPRTDPRRAAWIVWGGWLLVTGATFSAMGGIFHEYYTVALAPAIAALVGMGAAECWERRQLWSGRLVAAAAAAATGGWAFVLLGRVDAYPGWLRPTLIVATVLASAGLLLADRMATRLMTAVVATTLVVSLTGPVAYAVTTVNQPATGSIVTAGPAVSAGRGNGPGGLPGGRGLPGGQAGQAGGPQGMPQGGTPPQDGQSQGGFPQGGTPQGGTGMAGQQPGGQGGTGGMGGMGGAGGLLDASEPSAELVALVSADSSSYTWVAAAVGSQRAAGVQLATELPVMAVGGFNGTDPSPTLAEFQQLVADGEIHYFLGGGQFGGASGGSDSAGQIDAWVTETFASQTIDGQTIYDLTSPVTS